MARTLRIPAQGLQAGRFVLRGDEAHYLTRVQRCRVGDRVQLFDPARALEALGEIIGFAAGEVTCELTAPVPASRRGCPAVHLVQALGKGDKPEDVLRAAVALGVGGIAFVESERSVVRRTDPVRDQGKRERWDKVVLSAAQQSLRGDAPAVRGPLAWQEALPNPQHVTRYVLHPAAGSLTLGAALSAASPAAIEIWIGPEGGFSPTELGELGALGAHNVGLGPLVLRTELAAVAALAVAMDWALRVGVWDRDALVDA